MRTRLSVAVTGALIGLGLAVAGCSGSATPTQTSTLTIYAAASMQTTFDTLKTTFEAEHPGTTVMLNYAGSQALATQLVEGATADVFVSANDTQMKVVTDAGLNAADPRVFATNQLQIAVPPSNPAAISTFADLTKPEVKLVVCAPAVPCGAATVKVEKATGVTLAPVSEEQAVTSVLSKVQAGEADAGLVYKTDVIAAGDTVTGIEFPESSEAINRNPVVLLKSAPQGELGQAWIDLLFSEQGQQVFADAGFGAAQ
jgi:molybdate transport system substrate-binding protein